jgi:hypothetical protein
MDDERVYNWLIISWRHIDLMDGAYGKLLTQTWATEEQAKIEARKYVPNYSPVGIVRAVE